MTDQFQTSVIDGDTPQAEKQPIPNASTALILALVSWPLSCISYGIFVIITGIISMVLASKAKNAYKNNPAAYESSSHQMAQIAFVSNIVLLILSAILIILMVVYIGFLVAMLEGNADFEDIFN